MYELQKEQLSEILRRIVEILDIPESRYKEAVEKYKEVGQWLGAPDSPLYKFSPEIYPQGSFRLGTMIRPLLDNDEYDIDLVCRLLIRKDNITQKELKSLIGNRLKEQKDFRDILEESRRCWILHFEKRFHMDILPAIPDEEGLKESILITDKELRFWQHSNPIGYANWFWDRMKPQAEEQLKSLAESLRMSIEEVPRWKVKTPLQRVVQLLKRHRDIYFQNDQEDKPCSIIITTLAAHAYDNEAGLYDAIVGIVRKMPNYIETRNGVYWVPNPVNPKENFADKWREHPERREKFYAWLEKVENDFTSILQRRGIHEIGDGLGARLGKAIVTEATKGLGNTYYQQRQAGNLRMTSGSGLLGSSGNVVVKGHTFYGNEDEV